MKAIVSQFSAIIAILLTVQTSNVSASEDKNQRWGVPPSHTGKLLSLVQLNIRDAELEEIINGLNAPRAFEFINDHELLITEIGGQLKHYDLRTKILSTIPGLPKIATGHPQTGLIDVVIHPDFANTQRIYISYSVSDEETGKYFLTAVSSAKLTELKLTDVQEIFRAEPFGWSPSNFGGAMVFDDKGFLYITTGDRSEFTYSQSGDRLEGKVLRLKDDGSTPTDNPFVGDKRFDERIYALGVRNAQGLYFDANSGVLFEAEHGPLGGDEINIIKAGANYGWPTITYGQNYTTESIGIGTHAPGLEQPLFYYLPSVAISPLVMYRGDMFPEWEGDLLAGALKGKHVSKLDLDEGVIRSEYPILNEIDARIRDIKVATDGSIYVLAQTGYLYRLFRTASTQAHESTVPPASGEQVYQLSCAGCHDIGAHEAPRLGHIDDWQHRFKQDDELILKNTINGIGKMPKRGLCGICSDEHLKSAIHYMKQQLEPDIQ